MPYSHEVTNGLESLSVKSALSSHASDQVSRKSAIDPLDAYAETMLHQDQSDRTSVRSINSKTSVRSTVSKNTLKGDQPTSPSPKSLPRQPSMESLSKRTVSRQSSIDDANKGSISRKSSTESGFNHPQTADKESKDRSQSNRAVANATLLQDDEDEREDLESNVDFGKTTLFGKTRNLGLTYKALSQASDEEEDVYSDNFSDRPYNNDDDF